MNQPSAQPANAPPPDQPDSTREIEQARLTAYGLGELDADAAAEVELRLAGDPALRAYIKQVQHEGQILASAYRARSNRLTETQNDQLTALIGDVEREPSLLKTLAIAAGLGIAATVAVFLINPDFRLTDAAEDLAEVAIAPDPPETSNRPADRPVAPPPDKPATREPSPAPATPAHTTPPAPPPPIAAPVGRVRTTDIATSGGTFVAVTDAPRSQVAITLSTADTTALEQALLEQRTLPAPGSVGIGALLHTYADTAVPPPDTPSSTHSPPVRVSVEVGPAPWQPDRRLVRIGVQIPPAGDPTAADNPPPGAKGIGLTATFNQTRVRSYRLIGADPADDPAPTDGATLPAGHTATLLYELIMVDTAAHDAPLAAKIQEHRDAIGNLEALMELADMTAAKEAAMAAQITAHRQAIRDLRADMIDPPTGPSPSPPTDPHQLLALQVSWHAPAAADPADNPGKPADPTDPATPATPITEPVTTAAFPVPDTDITLDRTSDDFRFTAAVAGFGMLLKRSPAPGSATFDTLLTLAETAAETAAGQAPDGRRSRFIQLIKAAINARTGPPSAPLH